VLPGSVTEDGGMVEGVPSDRSAAVDDSASPEAPPDCRPPVASRTPAPTVNNTRPTRTGRAARGRCIGLDDTVVESCRKLACSTS